MITLMNVDENDKRTGIIASAIEAILSCNDKKYVEEIYAKDGSIVNGSFSDWVSLMIEVSPEFENESLYDAMEDIEEYCEDNHKDFVLLLSVEPNMAERGSGTVLWKRGD